MFCFGIFVRSVKLLTVLSFGKKESPRSHTHTIFVFHYRKIKTAKWKWEKWAGPICSAANLFLYCVWKQFSFFSIRFNFNCFEFFVRCWRSRRRLYVCVSNSIVFQSFARNVFLFVGTTTVITTNTTTAYSHLPQQAKLMQTNSIRFSHAQTRTPTNLSHCI